MATGGTPEDLSRRRFLAGTAAGLAAIAVGCGSDDDGDDGGTGAAPTEPTSAPTTLRQPPLAGDPFTLGVASGDPATESVILWTRLAIDPIAADGLGGMPAEPIDVECQVATDEAFIDVVATFVAAAEPDHAHAVHVEATGLEPGTEYHYRFLLGDLESPVGRTRTLPNGSPERFGIGVVNCQWFEVGTYAAYRHLLDEPIDLVLHLGDYIYEFPGGDGERGTLPAHTLESLTDYRLRYASYRLDADLRNAHARYPWVLTWDDHEVSNNYAGDVLEDDPTAGSATERKAAAYKAWWEHQPTRLAPPTGPELAVNQAVDIGDLARIYVLDERQHADPPPCRDLVEGDFGDCADRTAGDRAYLGEEQEAWLGEEAARAGVTWNLLGNPVVLAGVDGGNDADGPAYYLDSWDGYPTARARLIELLGTVENPVVLTGDYHAGMVLDVCERPFEDSPVVAPEFMAPPISSVLFPADVSGRTPQLRQQLNHHGYLAVELTPALLTATFRILDDVADPASAITTGASWTVTPGDPVARPA
jgi:alkaline phosphatase D